MTVVKIFTTGGFGYRARYLESNRETALIINSRNENTISFLFASRGGASYEYCELIEDVISVEEGVERFLFKSPSGRTVIAYADNRLRDNNYLKNHKIEL